MTRHPAASLGFTLVELLTVLGIIAVLLAILLPTLGDTRLRAQGIVCQSNLRQIGQGIMIYANTERGFMPNWSGVQIAGNPGTPPDSPGLGWTELLEPYGMGPSSKVFDCPSFPTEDRINYFIAARYSFRTGRFSMKLSEISNGTTFMLSADCTTPQFYPPPFGNSLALIDFDDCDKDDATQRGLLFAGQNNGVNVHREGNNIVFADGHTDTLKRHDPQRLTYHPTQMLDWDQIPQIGELISAP